MSLGFISAGAFFRTRLLVVSLVTLLLAALVVTAEPPIRAATPEATSGFVSLSPARVLDTRAGSGPVVPGSPMTVELDGVPADAAAAVVNVTATGATGDGFVTKIDADGDWVLATHAGGTGFDLGRGVSALADGSAIITGLFAGTARFGEAELTSAGGNDMFVARVTASGAFD